MRQKLRASLADYYYIVCMVCCCCFMCVVIEAALSLQLTIYVYNILTGVVQCFQFQFLPFFSKSKNRCDCKVCVCMCVCLFVCQQKTEKGGKEWKWIIIVVWAAQTEGQWLCQSLSRLFFFSSFCSFIFMYRGEQESEERRTEAEVSVWVCVSKLKCVYGDRRLRWNEFYSNQLIEEWVMVCSTAQRHEAMVR